MKYKKVIIFLFVILGLFVFSVFAVNMVNKQVHNIITFGSLKVKLLQFEEKNGEEVLINNNDQFDVTNNPTQNRNIKVCNVGEEALYARIALKMTGIDNSDFPIDDVMSYESSGNFWIYKDGFYYFNRRLNGGECSKQLNIKMNFDINKINEKYPNSYFTFDVNLYAVQAKNNSDNALQAKGWPKE